MSQMDFEMARPRTENKGHMRSNETSANRATDYSPMVSTEPIIFWQTWWWWWEIMAVIICIASTSGLVVLLKSIDNTPLRQWLLPIQPNSLIAVLTTINRAALLAPAASCISQLKWRHFVSAPRRLTDLQAFDAASRGPWGSLLFLFQVSSPVKALVTVGFAFLTILTLGIDPSAQQLLAFPVQETEISDRSVLMGMATGYISKSTNAVTVNPALNPQFISLQYEVLNSLRGSTFNSFYTCPQKATRCTYENLTTLGVCSSWNSALVASDGCQIGDNFTNISPSATFASCNYTLSNPNSGNPQLAAVIFPVTDTLSFRIPTVDSTSLNKVFQSHLIPGPYTNQTEFGEFWALRAPKNTNFSTPASFKPPAAEAFYASFYWCTRTFEGITAGPGGVEYVATSSERLTILANDTKIGNGKGNTYAADSTGVRYTIEEATYEGVTMYLNTLLVTEAVDQAVPLAEGAILSTGALLYQQDLGNMTTSIADTMTNIMRSSVLDENYNVTNVAGTAFFNETYIRVSWLWILLPVFETAFVTTLFVLSVVVTSKHPLLKDSVLAYLSTAAKDDVDRPSDLIMTQWTTQAELNGLAADMIVQLEPDDHGQLNFIRKDIVA